MRKEVVQTMLVCGIYLGASFPRVHADLLSCTNLPVCSSGSHYESVVVEGMIKNGLHPKHLAAPRALRCFCGRRTYSQAHGRTRRHIISEGRQTNPDESPQSELPRRSPFYFETAYSGFAKRATRPFPPPFVTLPSGSFSDPLTTHNRPHYRRPQVDGELLRGLTNGDDAIIIGGQNFLAVNDGVGAWAQKDRGHAALWSRLIAHYWEIEAEKAFTGDQRGTPIQLSSLDPVGYLDIAYNRTKEATAPPNEILGTTTASSALLHHREDKETPVVLATTLGDCAIFIIRPKPQDIIYKTTEQWHWFDCPRQLGTNSPDTPKGNAVMDIVDVEEGDIVVAMSDGVTDNLWEHEIAENVCQSLEKWNNKERGTEDGAVYVARELMNAARVVAQDPYAESPYMERALDEGIAAEGGKLDDISVVIGICRHSGS